MNVFSLFNGMNTGRQELENIGRQGYEKKIKTMGHRKQMTDKERLKFDLENYAKRLQANKGSNYEYWNEYIQNFYKYLFYQTLLKLFLLGLLCKAM